MDVVDRTQASINKSIHFLTVTMTKSKSSVYCLVKLAGQRSASIEATRVERSHENDDVIISADKSYIGHVIYKDVNAREPCM